MTKTTTKRPRRKNRIMAYDTEKADEVTVQLELDNGEVVQARYGRVIWLKPTIEAAKGFDQVFAGPPISIYGNQNKK